MQSNFSSQPIQPGNSVQQVEPSLQPGYAASPQAMSDLLAYQAMQVEPRPRVLHSSDHIPDPRFKLPTELESAPGSSVLQVEPSLQPGYAASPQAMSDLLAYQAMQVEPRPRVLHSSDHIPDPRFKLPTELESAPGNSVLQVEPSFVPLDYAASRQATDVLPPLTHQAMQVHSSGHTPNPKEKFKPLTEQESAWKYHSQPSVPFGQQEQPSTKEDENFQWEEVQDRPQYSQNSLYFSSVGTSEDSGQHIGPENEAQNGVSNGRDDPDRGRSRTDGLTANTTSGQNPRISQSHAEKVPVERVSSNDYDVEAAQHLHQKCPVEMSYNCISRYFNSSGKKLGEGGFGIVYSGTRTIRYYLN